MSKRDAINNSTMTINGQNISIGQWIRTEDGSEKNSNEQIYYLRKSHIISPPDEFVDFTKEEKDRALELTNKRRKKPGVASYPNGQIVRNELRDPKNPLLLIYLLDPKESLTYFPLPEETNPFVGYAISFPKSKFNAPVSYAVNEELLPQFSYEQDTEEDEDYGYEED